MNEVQKTINEAFKYIASIPVTGDAVELMAAAKDALRRAYKLAEVAEEDETAEEKDNG